MPGVTLGAAPITGVYVRGALATGVYVGAQRVWPPPALGVFPIRAGAFQLSGCPLLVETAQSIRITPSAMTFTGSRLRVDTGASVDVALSPGALDITPAPLEVAAAAAPALQPAAYSFAPQPLAVSAGQALTLGAGAMHLTPQALEFGTTSNVALNIVPGALQITYSPLTVNAGSAVALAMQPGAVTLAPQPLTASAGAALPINAGAMTFTQRPLSVALGAALAVTPGAVTFTSSQPTVAAGAALDIDAGALAIAGQTLVEDVGAAASAPPAFIASTNLHNDASVALPSGTLAGDYLVMAITGYDDGTLVNAVSLPANSDVIVASTRFGSSHLLAAWGHVVTAAEVSAGSVAFGNTHAYGFVAAYRPVGATAVNVVGTVATLGSGSGSNVSLTAPGITTSADNTALLQFCSVFSGSSTVSGTITAPSGYTQDAVEYDNYNYAMSLARTTQAAAGSSGDVTAVWNSANAMTAAAVVLFAINGGSAPAVSLTTTPTASVSDTTARISFRVSA